MTGFYLVLFCFFIKAAKLKTSPINNSSLLKHSKHSRKAKDLRRYLKCVEVLCLQEFHLQKYTSIGMNCGFGLEKAQPGSSQAYSTKSNQENCGQLQLK